MFCPKCGTPYLENDKFCSNCAARLDTVLNVQQDPQAVAKPPEYKPFFEADEPKTYTPAPEYAVPQSSGAAYNDPSYSEPEHDTYANIAPTEYTDADYVEMDDFDENESRAEEYRREQNKRAYAERAALDAEPKKKFKSIYALTYYELKRVASSPAMIVSLIMFTLGVMYSIYSNPLEDIYSASSGALSYVLGSFLDLIYEIPFISKIYSSLTFILNLPSILTVVSLWIVFSSALDKNTSKIATGALTFIKAIVIVKMIFVLLFYAVISFLSLQSMEIMSYLFDDASTLICFVPVAAFVIAIIYNVCLLSTLSTVKNTALYGYPSSKISGFLIFCCYFSGIASIVLNCTNPIVLPEAIAILSFGILLGKYKHAMQRIEETGRQYVE